MCVYIYICTYTWFMRSGRLIIAALEGLSATSLQTFRYIYVYLSLYIYIYIERDR